MIIVSFLVALLAPPVISIAPAGPWDAFNFAPSGRTFTPKSVHSTVGSVVGAENLLGSAQTTHGATLSGNGSYIALDFGQEVGHTLLMSFTTNSCLQVGGRLTFDLESTTSSSTVTLSFTESPMFISPTESDDSCRMSPFNNLDGVLTIPTGLTANETEVYTQTIGDQRGGFRYLTIASTANDVSVTISNLILNATFMPQFDNLNGYTGYFYAIDTTGFHDPDFLTKIWYGG